MSCQFFLPFLATHLIQSSSSKNPEKNPQIPEEKATKNSQKHWLTPSPTRLKCLSLKAKIFLFTDDGHLTICDFLLHSQRSQVNPESGLLQVKNIISKRTVNGRVEYEIEWAPYKGVVYPNSWEPAQNLNSACIRSFHEKRKMDEQKSTAAQSASSGWPSSPAPATVTACF